MLINYISLHGAVVVVNLHGTLKIVASEISLHIAIVVTLHGMLVLIVFSL